MATRRLTKRQRRRAERYLPLWRASVAAYSKKWPWLQQEIASDFGLALVQVVGSHDRRRGVKLATRYHFRVLGAMKTILRAAGSKRPSPASYVEPLDPMPGPEASAEARDELAKVQNAFLALLPIGRSALTLHACEGLEISEIASTLDISPASVKQRIHRARVLLRKLCPAAAAQE